MPPASDNYQDPAVSKEKPPLDPKPDAPVTPASNPYKDPAVRKGNPPPDTKSNDPAPLESSPTQDPVLGVHSVSSAAIQVIAVGHTVAVHSSGGIAIDGNHLSEGSSETTISGIHIAQNSAGIVLVATQSRYPQQRRLVLSLD